MLLRIIILLMILVHQQIVYANPAPIDLELNKATLQDIKRTHKILSEENTPYGGKEYFLDIKNINIQQLKIAKVLCDENGIVQGVQLVIDKNRFEDIYHSIDAKYEQHSKTIPSVGDKIVRFKYKDSYIILSAPHMSFNLYLTYLTQSISQKISQVSEEEEAERRLKEEQSL